MCIDITDEELGLTAKVMCNHERENPMVYKMIDGRVYVDFHVDERFDAEEWLELVRKVNDKLFELLMEREVGVV
jgi:hypothetical protein